MEGNSEKLVNKPIQKRVPIKSQSVTESIRKHKLRESCFRRVRADRTRLLWKLRLSCCQSSDQKEIINSALQDIVSDELKKIEDSSRNLSDSDDVLWEYDDGVKYDYEGDSEEILLEMQKMFYKDLISETTTYGSYDQIKTWEDAEDEYLATLVSQNMLLNSGQEQNQIWCPICKRGELMENHRHIYCNMCEMQLSKGEEVSLNILQERLAEAHSEHLERGCRLKAEFSVQSHFNLKALYITCEACNSFQVVV